MMNKRRMVSAFVALAFVVTAFVAVNPAQEASATTSWPISVDGGGVARIVAHSGSNVTVLVCDGATNYYVVDSNNVTPSTSVGTFTCDYSSGATAHDGTVYGTYTSGGVHYFAAVKNGRIKWATLLHFDSSCTSAGANMSVTSLTTGANGNVYFVANSTAYDCHKYLIGLDSSTGSVIMNHDLGWLGLGAVGWGVIPQVFTYNDYLTVVTTGGLLMEYSYDNVENTSAEYQFPSTDGKLVANKNGRVFLLAPNTGASWSGWVNGTIYSHDHDGSTGSRSRNDAGGPNYTYTVTGDGGLIRYGAHQGIMKLNMDGSNVGLTVPLPSGYAGGGDSFAPYYAQDSAGNAVLVREVVQAGTSKDSVLVDYIDSSGTVTNLYTRDSDGTWADAAYAAGTADVAGGYIFQAVLESVNLTTGSNHTSIQRLAIPGTYGTALNVTNNFVTTYVKTLKNYVAMGDSYSSGEGNPSFERATDNQSPIENRCHRSPSSYPRQLAASSSLGLKLTDFVACSGAITSQVAYGGSGVGAWNEGSQVNVLSEDTDIVTITIGGNDVNFSDYMLGCTVACGPGPGAILYDPVMSSIDSSAFTSNLESLYNDILAKAPNADIYVGDYPYIGGEGASNCGEMDFTGVYSVETELNTVIHTAVQNVAATHSKLHYVEMNYSGSPFEGKYLCNGGTSFLNGFSSHSDPGSIIPVFSFSFHPNADGEAAYATVFGNAIAANE